VRRAATGEIPESSLVFGLIRGDGPLVLTEISRQSDSPVEAGESIEGVTLLPVTSDVVVSESVTIS